MAPAFPRFSFQNQEVFRHPVERHLDRRRDLGNRRRALGEPVQDCPAGGVGESLKNGVQSRVAIFNHTVEYKPVADFVKSR